MAASGRERICRHETPLGSAGGHAERKHSGPGFGPRVGRVRRSPQWALRSWLLCSLLTCGSAAAQSTSGRAPASQHSAQAAAQPQEGSVFASLELTGPGLCGSTTDLERRIRLRSERIVFAASEKARRVIARIERRRRGAFIATLIVQQSSGASSSRRVRAENCEDALDALALIAAVSLDPSSRSSQLDQALPGSSGDKRVSEHDAASKREPLEPQPSSSDTSPDAPRDAALTKAPAGSKGPRKLGPARQRAKGPAAEPERLVPAASARGPSGSNRSSSIAIPFTFGIGLSGEANVGVAPRWMPGVGLFTSFEWAAGPLFRPALRLSVVRTQRDGFVVTGGTASFVSTVVTLEVCPFDFRVTSLSLRPCGLLAGGALVASGSQTSARQSHTRAWWLSGGSLVIAYEALPALEIVAKFSAGAPWSRDQFQFEPVVFHRVSAMVVGAGLGVGLRFP